ncbi:MAG TPA: AbrB/MazE/SpoVT family DNA-binding domain-containing protein [Chloroflexota bacterium]|nr:AbrB/MazE/SpoVT family DNA-binding domain-containing protein [Chloroflexota bacterium]
MRAHVQRWGNSLAVRIPKRLADEAGIGTGTLVDVTLDGGAIVARPIGPSRVTLDELLARLDPATRPESVDWGAPVGREVW